MTLFGIEIQQNTLFPSLMSGLLDDVHPDLIVELGTGRGGMTAMLGVWAFVQGAVVLSWDNERTRTPNTDALLKLLGVEVRRADYFSAPEREYIANAIQVASRVLFICDGGNKVNEMLTFGLLLPAGSVIMAHDYAPDSRAQTNRYKERIWHCCEITDDAVLKMRKFGFDFFAPELAAAAWVCLRKG